MKIGLFIPCYVDVVYPEVGVATYKLLKHLGLDVDYPLNQTCCGQPMANAGFEAQAIPLAENFEEKFKGFDYVVSPSVSCTAFIKLNYPRLLKKDHECETAKKAMDVVEFLHEIEPFLYGGGVTLELTDKLLATTHNRDREGVDGGVENVPILLREASVFCGEIDRIVVFLGEFDKFEGGV